ncbi:hypothetical protein K2173_008645 [Erythroxylum novogranatense]|uniref:Uncharacterized protein n=1 Tax=Erythroxylum novogranatense TaxID=1862640 RepID=A0AAV8SLX6_9ROSI|nr:hypothetical protein K2173_008645 [Erythroxylum novogranatense]
MNNPTMASKRVLILLGALLTVMLLLVSTMASRDRPTTVRSPPNRAEEKFRKLQQYLPGPGVNPWGCHYFFLQRSSLNIYAVTCRMESIPFSCQRKYWTP